MKTSGLDAPLGRVMIALATVLATHLAAADERAIETVRSAPPVEIDRSCLKIDVGAQIKAIDASLRKAVVISDSEAADQAVTVAIAETRARG